MKPRESTVSPSVDASGNDLKTMGREPGGDEDGENERVDGEESKIEMEKLAENYEELNERKLIEGEHELYSGWNFASIPTDRENTNENSQNSQFCSIQASHSRTKINENS